MLNFTAMPHSTEGYTYPDRSSSHLEHQKQIQSAQSIDYSSVLEPEITFAT